MSNQIKYLDPKNDVTFRKIFGEHPHLLISFLNNILPLPKGEKIVHIEYLDSELLPELPKWKRSIVDVRCIDSQERTFIVEMQMYWTSAFRQRMLFNANKVYVRQLKKGGRFRDLHPVYGLALIDDIFDSDKSAEKIFYHHFKMYNEVTRKQIKGVELVFVELPKFKSNNFTDKRLITLWLRFLTEINESTTEIPEVLKNEKIIQEALECVRYDSFTEEELIHYDKYWDAVRIEKEAMEALKERNQQLEKEKAKAEQKAEEAEQKAEEAIKEKESEQRQKEEAIREKAEAEQKAEAALKRAIELKEKFQSSVLKFHKKGISAEEIAEDFGISVEEVLEIIHKTTAD